MANECGMPCKYLGAVITVLLNISSTTATTTIQLVVCGCITMIIISSGGSIDVCSECFNNSQVID